jgi:polyisoprenoid-binding protein YceI
MPKAEGRRAPDANLEVTMRSVIAGVVCFVVLAAASGAFAVESYRIDPDHTFVHFAVVHTGVSSVRGRIGVARGEATLDTTASTAEFTVDVDMRTLETGVKKLDALLSGEAFFDVGKFKTARFTGHAGRFADGVPVEFDGELTIRDTTRPVHLAAERFVCKEVTILVLKRFVCGGDLTATLKRSDFGISKYLSMVSDEVRLRISVEAIRADQ